MSTSPKQHTRILKCYETWLGKQPLSNHTRRAYLTQVRQYLAYLAQTPLTEGDPLQDAHARDYAVRDYKVFLKTVRKRKPSTVNLALAALDHFSSFLKLPPANVAREELPQRAPRALNESEQKRFLRAVERNPSVRDKAVARLLFYTGLRVGEVEGLNDDDVLMSARKGKVIVRSGKGDAYREVPLNAEVRKSLKAWLKARREQFPEKQGTAFFLNRRGVRLSARAIDLLLRKLGKEAGLALSAHVLRHTCITNLVRNGNDLVLVAEIAGHRRLETTRRYSLPSERDLAAAMEALQKEY